MFPNVVIPITAGRGKSIKLLEDAYNNKEYIGVICQKNSDVETPKIGDLNSIGTISRIIKIIKLPNGNITAITRGVHRFRAKNYISTEPFFRAEIQKLRDSSPKNKEEFYALIDNIKDLALKIIELDPNIPNAANFAIKNIDGLFHLVLKLKNGIEDRTIWETSYSSDLRLIRKIILEYKVKGEE